MKKKLCGALLILLSGGAVHAGIINGDADLVLGQADFTDTSANAAGGSGLKMPRFAVVDEANDRVFVADTLNNRVLWWNSIEGLTNGKTPDGVLGQADLDSVLPNRGGIVAVNTLSMPNGIAIDAAGNVWAADFNNNRVVRYSGTLSSGMDADLVLGQTAFTNNSANRGAAVSSVTLKNPTDMVFDAAGALWVCDADNNRVLRYAGPFTNGQAADLVIGQPDFNSNDSHDINGDTVADVVTAATLYAPQGISIDPAGSIWVADHLNHRYLRYPSPFTDGMNADLVLGQADFTSGRSDRAGPVAANALHCAYSLAVDKFNNVWAADFNNNRLLRYSGALSNGMSPTQVIGQSNFTSYRPNRTGTSDTGEFSFTPGSPNGSPGGDTLFHPSHVAVDSDGSLWVTDAGNSRLLKFNALNLASINISEWANVGTKTLNITGEDFVPGMTVKLVRPGQSDIAGSGLNVASQHSASALFDFEGAGLGAWDLVASNDNYSAVLSGALTILPLRIASISPSGGVNTAAVTVTLTGENFFSDIPLKLTRTGFDDIEAEFVTAVSTTQITAVFDIAGAGEGLWNVVVPPGTTGLILPGAFNISTIKVISAAPARGVNSEAVDVVISGENFVDGMTARLTRDGYADVPAVSAVFRSSSALSARFGLVDVSTGTWSIAVTSNVITAALEDGFSVHYPSAVVKMIYRNRGYRLGIETDRGVVIVDIAPETFSDDVWLTLREPAALVSVAQSGIKPSDVSLEMFNDKNLEPLKYMGITFYYNEAYVDGLDKSKLAVCYCDEARGRWIPLESSAMEDENTVGARAMNLCVFRVAQRAALADLDNVVAYPNPYRPGSGGLFDNSALGAGVVFSGLTSRATIRIYTVAGEMVTTLNEEDGDGIMLWNAENDKQEKVASGVYLYYITDSANSSRKAKGSFAVIK